MTSEPYATHGFTYPKSGRDLLKLLSRFALTSAQARRWFDPSRAREGNRDEGVRRRNTGECVPYERSRSGRLERLSRIRRHDRPRPSPRQHGRRQAPGASSVVDRVARAMPDGSGPQLSRYSAMPPQTVTPSSARRRHFSVWAIWILPHPCVVQSDWPSTNRSALDGVVELVDVPGSEPRSQTMSTLQLAELKDREDGLRVVLSRRAGRPSTHIKSHWKQLLESAIALAGGKYDSSNERHVHAISEQADALDRLTSRRLSVLVGRAGTGKTVASWAH